MDFVSTRHFGLGIAGALTDPAVTVVGAGVRAAGASWRTPMAAPVRRPARALVKAASHRGAVDETRLLAATTQASSAWFDRALRTLVEARLLERAAAQVLAGETLERVLAVAAEHRAGIRAADAIRVDDNLERLLAHVIDQPAVDRVVERALATMAAQQRVPVASEEPREMHDLVEAVRERTVVEDDQIEGVARRLLRRRAWATPPFVSFGERPAPA
jgi:hypothetical protein